jgi:hypothetical protein
MSSVNKKTIRTTVLTDFSNPEKLKELREEAEKFHPSDKQAQFAFVLVKANEEVQKHMEKAIQNIEVNVLTHFAKPENQKTIREEAKTHGHITQESNQIYCRKNISKSKRSTYFLRPSLRTKTEKPTSRSRSKKRHIQRDVDFS